MTDIGLPYDRVCEIIDVVAVKEICPYSKVARTSWEIASVRHLIQYGHALLRALEEAHLARQEEVRPDEAEMAGHDGRYDGRM